MSNVKDYFKYLKVRIKIGLPKPAKTSDRYTIKWLMDYIKAYTKAFSLNLIQYNSKKNIHIKNEEWRIDKNGKRYLYRADEIIYGYDLNWPWTKENIDKALFEIACGN